MGVLGLDFAARQRMLGHLAPDKGFAPGVPILLQKILLPNMLFPIFHGKHGVNAAQTMIGEHSRWLTWALSGGFWGKSRAGALPRIPVRKVSEGGFAQMMSTPAGR